MDPSTAAAWRDLYIGTVGAGASLTGLTFVAIALDPHQIERTPLLRLRAASALWCFVSVMFIGLAVLTPSPFRSVASVAVGVGGISGAVLLSVRTIRQRIFQPAASRRECLPCSREHLRVPPRRCRRPFADRRRAGLGVCHAGVGVRDHAVERHLRELAASAADRGAVKRKALSPADALASLDCRIPEKPSRNPLFPGMCCHRKPGTDVCLRQGRQSPPSVQPRFPSPQKAEGN